MVGAYQDVCLLLFSLLKSGCAKETQHRSRHCLENDLWLHH
jgi:hypothetical protein